MLRVIILVIFLAGCVGKDNPSVDRPHIMCDTADKTAWLAKHHIGDTWFFNRISELDEKCK